MGKKIPKQVKCLLRDCPKPNDTTLGYGRFCIEHYNEIKNPMAKKLTQVEENAAITEHNKKKIDIGLRKKQDRKPKTTKKVLFASGKDTKDIPKILIEGIWLKQFDFAVGDVYDISGEEGKIILTRQYGGQKN